MKKTGKVLLASLLVIFVVGFSINFALGKQNKENTAKENLESPAWFRATLNLIDIKIQEIIAAQIEAARAKEEALYKEEKPYTEEDFQKDMEEIAANDVWKILLTVKYRFYRNQYIPQFSNEIKAYQNKTVTLKGYMYPLEDRPKQDFFILSYYPIAQCFFCGGAGPESVVEINSKEPIKVTQKPIKLKGTLKLNPDDPERLFYILLDSEIVD